MFEKAGLEGVLKRLLASAIVSQPENPQKIRPATPTQKQQQQDATGVVKNPLLLTSVVVAADWTRDDDDEEEEQTNSCCSCSCPRCRSSTSSSFLRSAAAVTRPDLFALALAHSVAFWGLFMLSKSSCGGMSGEEGFWSPRAVTTAAVLTYELAALATAAALLMSLSSSRQAKSSVEKIVASLAGAIFSVQWGAFSYLFWAALAE